MTLIEEISNVSKELKDLREQFEERAKNLFYDTVKKFFDAVPEITGFAWVQYTPYFNDGDECVFSVNDVSFATGAFEVDDINSAYDLEEFGAFCGGYSRYNQDCGVSEATYKMCHELNKLITNDLDDQMKDIFGDHCTVIVTRDGITTTEYEHE